MIFGSNRSVTQTFKEHVTAEDYSGNHLSVVSLMGKGKIVKVVNKFRSYYDSVDYYDFLNNQFNWKKGEYYNCTGISGNSVVLHQSELIGNHVVIETYVSNIKYIVTIGHLDSVLVNVGQFVDESTILGKQGNTGLITSGKSRTDTTYGTHIHVTVKDEQGKIIDPRPFALGDVKYEYIKQSNLRDETKNQIKIVTDKINIRKSHSVETEDIGDVFFEEYYDILEIVEDEVYKWYKIKTNTNVLGFVASKKTEEWIIEFNVKNEPEEVVEKNIKVLFDCPETGVYFIKLNKGETLTVY